MVCGPDGKDVEKMTWDEFIRYQRWDEFPELSDDPPMTDDFAFWLHGKNITVQEKTKEIFWWMKNGIVWHTIKIFCSYSDSQCLTGNPSMTA